jgi:hypothetical protein
LFAVCLILVCTGYSFVICLLFVWSFVTVSCKNCAHILKCPANGTLDQCRNVDIVAELAVR